jgi:hypothetical protein
VTGHITQGETSARVTSATGTTGRDAKAKVPVIDVHMMEAPVADATEVLDEAEIPCQLEV